MTTDNAGELEFEVTVPVSVTVVKRSTVNGSTLTVVGAPWIDIHGGALRGEPETAAGVWDVQEADWAYNHDVARVALDYIEGLFPDDETDR